ncbi:hypothetical protein FRC04_012223 [Tulasnella sp. 424]|nr:hypothetical protein FRC04_012223 [Tulasnella sp. 424]KAG8973709.1 hypothetical protein FRC05_008297 [Tulasnella sp. 425]
MDGVSSSPIKLNRTAAGFDTVAAARDHNSRRPIHQLPVELLVTILKDSIYYAPYSHYHIRLSELSQVAWYWRDIIQSTPSMWSVVSNINPAAVITAALEKSKMSPLDIDMSRSRGLGYQIPAYELGLSNDVFLDLVHPRITQWRSFHLRVDFELFLTRLQDPAPNLEEVILERPFLLSFHPQEIGDAILFAGSAPRLRLVNLSGIPFQWCSALLRGLKSLALEHMEVSWTDLFDVLCLCPGLAHVSFVWLHGHLPTDLESSSPPQITLAHLLHIRLENVPVLIASCVLHPRQMECCRRLEVRNLLVGHVRIDEGENLLLTWLDSVGPWVTGALRTSSMVDFAISHSSFSCSNARGTSGQFVINLNYVTAFAAATWLTNVSETTQDLTTHLRLSDLFPGSYFPNSQFGKALQRLPKVTDVDLTDHSSMTLLERYQWLVSTKPPSRSFVFPGLRQLHLKGGHWYGATICNMVMERYAVKGACADLAPLESLDLGAARGFSDKQLKWLAKVLGPGVVRGDDLPLLDQSSDTEVD